jgi:hypothetical protein
MIERYQREPATIAAGGTPPLKNGWTSGLDEATETLPEVPDVEDGTDGRGWSSSGSLNH